MNPTGRMQTSIHKDKKEESKETPVMDASTLSSSEPTVAKEQPEAEEKSAPEEALLELDLQNFFFSGRIEHTFDLKGGFKVTMKLLSSEELEETHKILWNLIQKEISTDMVTAAHTIEVLARTITKYGKVSLEDKKIEDKLSFVRANVPGVLLSILIKKYNLLERSADAAFSDKENLKN